MRLIDADALLNRMRTDPLFSIVDRYGVSGVIENEPTVDAEPVRHGLWYKVSSEDGDGWMCSECLEEWTFAEGHPKEIYGCNYCPNCGAQMR